MKLNKFDHRVATESALSDAYAAHLVCKATQDEDIANRVNDGVSKLIDLANEMVTIFDEVRNQYNKSVSDYRERIHFVPFLKVQTKDDVVYLRFVWCRLQNRAYKVQAGKLHEPGIIEIPPGSNGFYTAKKLNSLLDLNNKKALPILLETEHAMRYVRIEYQKYADIRWLVSSHRPSRYQQLRKKDFLNQEFTKNEMIELRTMNIALMFQSTNVDPFNIPVKSSLFKSEKIKSDCTD